MEKLLVYLVCKYQGDYRKITQAIKKGETYSHILIDECIQGLDCCYTTILSDNYPLALRDLKDPPYVLFYLGDLALASKPCISMVGMREPSPYGHRNARQTIAVLGCGIDICYPKSHQQLYHQIAKEGLLLSEFPPGTKPRRYYFPWRNRIVAALGKGLIVVEAKRKSGSMITVGHALALGKTVFALPCRITDYDGTLTLIQDGATPVISVEDIYESLNL